MSRLMEKPTFVFWQNFTNFQPGYERKIKSMMNSLRGGINNSVEYICFTDVFFHIVGS